MTDTAQNMIKKAHDKGVVFTNSWYDRLGYEGERPGVQPQTAASQISRQSTLSQLEALHNVYEGMVVPMVRARWPRKFLPGGTMYGQVSGPAELLTPDPSGKKILITDHQL